MVRLEAQGAQPYVRGEQMQGLRFKGSNNPSRSFRWCWEFYYPAGLRWTTQVNVVDGVIYWAARVLENGETRRVPVV